MTKLLIATAAFLVAHYVSSTPLRAWLVKLLGSNGYIVLYSSAAVATLVAMVWAYLRAPHIGLWYVPALRYAPLIVMPVALLLLVSGLITRNPTAVGQGRWFRGSDPARGILRVTRHPVMWAIALWAAAHVLARGDVASVVFFGAFLALAVTGTALIDRRKRAEHGENWRRLAEVTSSVPFAAIAGGRNRFDAGEIGWVAPALALAAYAALIWLHPLLFGARPY